MRPNILLCLCQKCGFLSHNTEYVNSSLQAVKKKLSKLSFPLCIYSPDQAPSQKYVGRLCQWTDQSWTHFIVKLLICTVVKLCLPSLVFMTRHSHLVSIDASVGEWRVTAVKRKVDWGENKSSGQATSLLVWGWVAWKRTSAPVSSPSVRVAAKAGVQGCDQWAKSRF